MTDHFADQSSSRGPWFKVGTDILDDPKFLRLSDADQARYLKLCALAKLSVDHTRNDSAIGMLLVGELSPMTERDIAAQLRVSQRQLQAFVKRLREVMPGALTIGKNSAWRLNNFARRQYDYPSEMPHAKRRRRLAEHSPTARPGLAENSYSDADADTDKNYLRDTPEWQAYRDALRKIPGYPFDPRRDHEQWELLQQQFPIVDLVAQLGRMHAWMQARGLLPVAGRDKPRLRILNWMRNAAERGASPQAPRTTAPSLPTVDEVTRRA